MKECLLKYRKKKTRVLVTHALYYLKDVDFIYILKDGRIIEQGDYKKISSS